jgi:uncharacterized membrane protein YedE/YeeE
MTKVSVQRLAYQLKQIIHAEAADKTRLPSERVLAVQLHTTRAKLRTAMRQLEFEGLVWRGVGKGTFVGPKPAHESSIKQLKLQENPAHVMRARLALEPELAGLAAAPWLLVWLAPASWIPQPRIEASTTVIVMAGLLVGLGTRYGSGCTSGHGVCGLSRLSPRSLAATLCFMAGGFLTVYVVRHLF